MTLMKHSLCVPWLSMCAMTPYVYHEYCMLPVQWEMHTGNIDRQWLKCLKTQNFFWILFPEFWFISLFAGTVCATTCVHAGLLSGKGTTPICWYVFAASRSADHSWWVEFFSSDRVSRSRAAFNKAKERHSHTESHWNACKSFNHTYYSKIYCSLWAHHLEVIGSILGKFLVGRLCGDLWGDLWVYV